MLLSLDDVCARMRERFTESGGAPVLLTADEWNALAQGVFIADALEAFLANPSDDALAAHAAALIRRTRTGR